MKALEKTVQDYVDFLQAPALLYENCLLKKYMYYIPLMEYNSVSVVKSFSKVSVSKVKKDWEVLFDMRDYIDEPIALSGIENILVLPFYFDTKPATKIVYPTVEEDDSSEEEESSAI